MKNSANSKKIGPPIRSASSALATGKTQNTEMGMIEYAGIGRFSDAPAGKAASACRRTRKDAAQTIIAGIKRDAPVDIAGVSHSRAIVDAIASASTTIIAAAMGERRAVSA
ncbi:hypothetical protein [Xanthobacter flavus]|uniref:hypothetical protein n=1 Tax=Xanthobacter flavus TaxID=281 RepID=UPI003727625F